MSEIPERDTHDEYPDDHALPPPHDPWINRARALSIAAVIIGGLIVGFTAAYLVAVLAFGAATIVSIEANLAWVRYRTDIYVTDVMVLSQVHLDPGHCATTYTHELPQYTDSEVRRSLARLVKAGELRTERHRHLDTLPLVDIYFPG